MPAPALLTAQPRDATADSGPRHRGGPFTIFLAVFSAFTAAGLGRVLWLENFHALSVACAVVLGLAALWAAWCIFEAIRHHGQPARGHAVLTDALGFDVICACHDVAATAFFEPDRLRAGSPARLFVFLENLASRQRIVRLQIGPHPHLGLARATDAALHLAAGQAAVYSFPLLLDSNIPAGEHDLPLVFHVERPTGDGARLAGRRHLHNLWTLRFAAPFTITNDAPPAPPPIAAPRFDSLASISEPSPRLRVLKELVRG